MPLWGRRGLVIECHEPWYFESQLEESMLRPVYEKLVVVTDVGRVGCLSVVTGKPRGNRVVRSRAKEQRRNANTNRKATGLVYTILQNHRDARFFFSLVKSPRPH